MNIDVEKLTIKDLIALSWLITVKMGVQEFRIKRKGENVKLYLVR